MEDRPSSPSRVWNRIPEAVRDRILNLALEEPELSGAVFEQEITFDLPANTQFLSPLQ